MLCGEFKYIIHKHLNQCNENSVASDQTIYLFVGNTSPKTGALMSEIYDQFKADDGFFYWPPGQRQRSVYTRKSLDPSHPYSWSHFG